MKITTERALREVEFWGGADGVRGFLTDDEMDTIESALAELYPQGMDETDLNDFIWFQEDDIARWLGYEDFEEILEERG